MKFTDFTNRMSIMVRGGQAMKEWKETRIIVLKISVPFCT